MMLTVSEGYHEDYAKSIGRVSKEFFIKYHLNTGEIVEIVSRDQRIGIILRPVEELLDFNEIKNIQKRNLLSDPYQDKLSIDKDDYQLHINGFIRSNLRVGLGQKVIIDKTSCPTAKEVYIAVLNPERKKEVYMEYLIDRPIVRGQTLELHNNLVEDLKIVILKTTPPGIVKINHDSAVYTSNETPIELSDIDKKDFVMYDDIGGHHDVIARLRTLIEYPLRYPEIFEMINIEYPHGILITGSTGTGKSYISKALANECGVVRFFVMATEIVRDWWGAEDEMDKYFNQVIKYEPAILVIDNIEVLAPAPSPMLTDLEKRLTEQLIKNLKKIQNKKIIIVGTTTEAKLIHPSLRVNGRLEIEIPLQIPNFSDRLEILAIHTRGMSLENINFQDIALETGGFSPADLELLIKSAGMYALERQNLLDIETKETETDILFKKGIFKITINQEDFRKALTNVKPSASREIIAQIPNITWNDIGGLDNIKQSLKEIIDWPIRYPSLFSDMGVRPPHGALLYGPPGTGKTLLAKAIANEVKANFLIVIGPDLLSKWFSESARIIRELFRRARQLAPCIIFFDEIDALVPKRGGGNGSSNASHERDRIINQLLALLDGIETMKGVFVLGATNRPDVIDPALLRPGRLDRLLFVSAPTTNERLKILQVHTKNMHLDPDVDLQQIALKTENFTGADLEKLCREAGLSTLRKNFAARVVTAINFQESLSICHASITPEILNYYKELEHEMSNQRVMEYIRQPQEFF